jgi:hypothetical protein
MDQQKSEIVKQIQETNNPVVKRILEKRLKEIDKTVNK